MNTTFVICAAGAGSRFKTLLPTVAKPLIFLQGKSLLEWSISSLPILPTDDVVIITQRADQIPQRLAPDIQRLLPQHHLKWLEIDHLTHGQLETVYLAKEIIDPKKSLVVYNSDTYFQSAQLASLIQNSPAEGIIPCSREPGTAWSFCRINSKEEVLAVTEKKRISPWASVGCYFFRQTEKFWQFAETELAQKTAAKGQEVYVAPLYERYLVAKLLVVIDKLPVFKPMGTPDQIETYWQITPKMLLEENSLPTNRKH